MAPSEKGKKQTRKSSKHSRTGCGTCKIRRVKCDESRPACTRCKDWGVDCDGYRTPIVPAGPRLLSEAPPLLPKNKTRQELHSTDLTFMTPLESVWSTNLIRITPFETDNEAKYYGLWHSSTVIEVLPYCQHSLHCTMLYGAANIPSIRHAMVALAALHEAMVTAKKSRTLPGESLDVVAKSHLLRALEHYSKAIKIMREGMISGKQDIRTTLVTCFVIFGFEAFYGNLAAAVAQVQTGVALIAEWKQDHELRGTPASKPDTEVLETFFGLEIQMISAHDNRSLEEHLTLRTEYLEKVRDIPSCFAGMWEATNYFYLVKKHVEHFARVAKTLATNVATSYQMHHQAELERWNNSFTALLDTLDLELDMDNKSRATWLRIHYISTKLRLDTVLAIDEMIYDQYTDEYSEVLKLSDVLLLEMMEKRCSTAMWTFDQSAVLPLFNVGVNCRVVGIRRIALAMLRRQQRREGIWDYPLVAKMVAWVQNLEKTEEDVELVPGWVRVVGLEFSFELASRSVEMNCRQRLGEGLDLVEKGIKIEW